MKYLKRANPPMKADQETVQRLVSSMLEEIRLEGEQAVRKFAKDLDGFTGTFRISKDEIESSADRITPELREAIDFALDQVVNFARLQRATLTDLEAETYPGVVIGHRHIPIDSVCAYVPGGRYSLIASAYMGVAPAKVAGVERVIVCTPPRNGSVHPGLLYAAHRAGADEIYAVGGVQALGAAAYGAIEGLDPVDMIVGAGNQYVVEAKRQLYGTVGIDLLAGPTEIGVLADDSADPFIVACDLVGQAEHDPLSRAVLITTSESLGEKVLLQMESHLAAVSTQEVARACWKNGGEVIIADSEEELIELSDNLALEHVEVLMESPQCMIRRLRNYGSLFVGEETTVAYGDKVSGANHVLPTHRSARFTGGLWVGKYLKTVTYQHMTPSGSMEMGRHCDVEAQAEGMFAHARTASVRVARYREASAEQ